MITKDDLIANVMYTSWEYSALHKLESCRLFAVVKFAGYPDETGIMVHIDAFVSADDVAAAAAVYEDIEQAYDYKRYMALDNCINKLYDYIGEIYPQGYDDLEFVDTKFYKTLDVDTATIYRD